MQRNNFEIFKNYAVVKVNPKIFSLDVIFMAAYVMIGRAHVFIDGDPQKEIEVRITPENQNFKIEVLVNEFNNELLSYQVYLIQSERTADLRKILLARALLSNATVKNIEETDDDSCDYESEDYNENSSDIDKFLENTEDIDFESDPESITIPWYNKNKDESKEFFKAVEEKIGTKIIKG